jgi:hypothetical protein
MGITGARATDIAYTAATGRVQSGFISCQVLTNDVFVRGFGGIGLGRIARWGANVSSTPTAGRDERINVTDVRLPAASGRKVIGAGLGTSIAGSGGLTKVSNTATTCRMDFTATVDRTGSVSVVTQTQGKCVGRLALATCVKGKLGSKCGHPIIRCYFMGKEDITELTS